MISGETKFTLYRKVKAGLKSLFIQTVQVSLGLILVLVVTGGNPPGWMVSVSFFLGVGFVAWTESKRQLELQDQREEEEEKKISLVKAIIRNREKGLKLQDANLKGANLKGANLKGAILYGANLKGANLEAADLKAANLYSANLYGANLKGANLEAADLEAADLEAADLEAADLKGANLEAANLEAANLEAANLEAANLEAAILVGANLVGANLVGANVEKAQFGNNRGIDEKLKYKLEKRGAIFVDSPEDPVMANYPVGR